MTQSDSPVSPERPQQLHRSLASGRARASALYVRPVRCGLDQQVDLTLAAEA